MEEIKKLIDGMSTAFEAFKAENDKRIKQIEANGKPDPLTDEKMKRITDDIAKMDEMKNQLNAIEKALALSMVPSGGAAKSDKVYKSLGEQLMDVVTMAHPDRTSSDYAAAAQRLNKVKAAATGAGEAIPSDGGFLVQTDFAGMLDQGAMNTGILSTRCFTVPISGNANGVKANLMNETSRATGSRYGGIQTYWAAEAATVTKAKPTFRQIELNLKKLFGLFYATDELMQDAAALSAMVNRWFPAEFGFKIDDAIINGTGAGQPLGILNSVCLVSVSKETGQTATTILFENIVKMYARLLDSSDANAVWFINRDILPQLFTMSLAVGTGGVPVFLPASENVYQSPTMTLLGKPLITIEQCATLGTVGDIILADLSEYMLIEKGGIQAAQSIHVQFIYDEMTFRWTYRTDGQPIRTSPLTPYKGSATRSPFIVLATRS
jgi:HK97 family phage major capsid protein